VDECANYFAEVGLLGVVLLGVALWHAVHVHQPGDVLDTEELGLPVLERIERAVRGPVGFDSLVLIFDGFLVVVLFRVVE